MLDLIFSIATYIALFLCVFSLIASMYTNIFEQSKEIGILRGIGLNIFKINKIYIYEALILVLTSSFCGIIVGSLLAYIIIIQQTLFTQYPIIFIIPYPILLAVINAAIITSIISVYLPLNQINHQTIASIIRIVL